MKWCLVGNRKGKPTIYWPGVTLAAILVSAISAPAGMLAYFTLCGRMLAWPGILAGAAGAVVAILTTAIVRGFRAAPDQLPKI